MSHERNMICKQLLWSSTCFPQSDWLAISASEEEAKPTAADMNE